MLGVGVTVGVGLGGGGVGLPPPPMGARTLIKKGEPVLKKLIMALLVLGGPVESNRKLYNVPKRIAFAF
jgi:hypothetical protein